MSWGLYIKENWQFLAMLLFSSVGLLALFNSDATWDATSPLMSPNPNSSWELWPTWIKRTGWMQEKTLTSEQNNFARFFCSKRQLYHVAPAFWTPLQNKDSLPAIRSVSFLQYKVVIEQDS
jgi:hypothetical protein